MPDHRPYRKWYMHRRDALRRGIEFKLTFEEWMKIWLDSGHWHERGRKRGQYVMARPGDKGAYETGNIKIILQADNTIEACLGKKHTAQARANMGASHVGKPRSEETKHKIRESNRRTYASSEFREWVASRRTWTGHTKESRRKMRLAWKKRRKNEAQAWLLGVKD